MNHNYYFKKGLIFSNAITLPFSFISSHTQRLEMKEALQTPRQRTLTPVVEIDGDVDKLTKENESLSEKLRKVSKC